MSTATIAKPLPELLNSKQAREFLGNVSQSYLRGRIKAGELTPAKFGNMYRFRRSELESFVASKLVKSVDAA